MIKTARLTNRKQLINIEVDVEGFTAISKNPGNPDPPGIWFDWKIVMAIQLENLVESIKSKVRALKKSKKPYIKMDKSSSVKVEIRSRKAKKLIDKTMRAADRPGKRTIS